MEIFHVEDNQESFGKKTVKKVPVLTEQIMATILHIPPKTDLPAHSHDRSDEIHYIVTGEGKITSGKQEENVNEGMLILVPSKEIHSFSTLDIHLVVLSFTLVSVSNRYTSKND